MNSGFGLKVLRLFLVSALSFFLVACSQERVEPSDETPGDVETPVVVESPADTVGNDNDQVCGGIAGLPCGEGDYCQMAEGTCNIADNMGVCRPQSEMCTRDYRPVCGCDGRTYGNACTAGGAAMSLDYMGECKVSE